MPVTADRERSVAAVMPPDQAIHLGISHEVALGVCQCNILEAGPHLVVGRLGRLTAVHQDPGAVTHPGAAVAFPLAVAVTHRLT